MPSTSQYPQTDALRWRLNSYAAVSFFILLLCGALMLALPLRDRGEKVARRLLTSTVHSHAQSVEAWMRHTQAMAWQVAFRPDLRAMLAKNAPIADTSRAAREKADAILAASMGITGDMAALALVNAQGQMVAQCGLSIPPKAIVQNTLGEQGVHISPPLTLNGETFLLISVPMLADAQTPSSRKDSPQALGRLFLLQNLFYLNKIFTDTIYDTPAPHYILRMHENALFSNATPSADKGPADYAARAALQEAFTRASAGQSGIYLQNGMAYAYSYVPYWQWELVGVVPVPNLYNTANSGFWSIIWGTLVVYAVCFTGFYILSRPLAGRILLHARELEEEVHQRQRAQQQLEHTLRLLQESYTQHQMLSGQILGQLEGMRRKIATELHDNTGQQLTTLLLDLELDHNKVSNNAANSEDVCRMFAHAAQSVRHIQRDIRRTAHGLYPPGLELMGLGGSIEHLCQEVTRSGLTVHCSVCSVPPISNEKALTLFRIVQEALNNAVRHSKASEAHITLNIHDGSLILTIEDNGVGFDPAIANARSASLGLRLMHERAHYCGGSVTIESEPHKGTLILVELPLGADA